MVLTSWVRCRVVDRLRHQPDGRQVDDSASARHGGVEHGLVEDRPDPQADAGDVALEPGRQVVGHPDVVAPPDQPRRTGSRR